EELAQFERAPQENVILLHDHILDKKILDLDDHEVEVVYDVKLAFQNGKLYAAEVDFSRYRALRRLGLHKLAKLMADRNKEDRVSWLYVQPLPAQLGSFAGSIKLKVPKADLREIHPVDLADILEELEGGQRGALFNAPELIRLPATTPAAEVLDRYRELATGKNVVTYVYVTDAAGTLEGVVDLREIVAAEPGQSLRDIMTEHVIALPKDATLREAVMLFERYNFRALPITDENHHLLGAVSSRDMRGLRPRLT